MNESQCVVKPGSTITRALRGIGHGVFDFGVGFLHDLQMAAVYMGSSELELPLQERIQIIEAVEHSQANHMKTVEDWIMDRLSIDESDTVYRSYRSKTTLGLEIGSLAAGGYGVVKRVMAFNKLAKMPVHIARVSEALGSGAKLNRFHQAARNLSETGKSNIRVLRGWAKSKGWNKLPNPQGRPEIWGVNTGERFEFRLKIKAESSLRTGLDPGSGIPRFDARLSERTYINPFTGEIGNSKIGTHIPLEYQFYE